uniref:Uncharacterized protein n=1 Tax=Glossina palpalis gambiensis TaxID=67801 RepID=A0A1B0B4S9_9MUSC
MSVTGVTWLMLPVILTLRTHSLQPVLQSTSQQQLLKPEICCERKKNCAYMLTMCARQDLRQLLKKNDVMFPSTVNTAAATGICFFEKGKPCYPSYLHALADVLFAGCGYLEIIFTEFYSFFLYYIRSFYERSLKFCLRLRSIQKIEDVYWRKSYVTPMHSIPGLAPNSDR